MPSARALVAIVIVVAAVAAYKPDVAEPKPQGSSSGGGRLDIPGDYYDLYRSVPKCPGLDWSVLAAIGKIETNHGRSKLPGVRSGANFAGAAGPMQFMPGTWAGVRRRHPEIGPNVYDPRHAIPAAARLLCDNGANASIRNALFSYNHAWWYVDQVQTQARKYSS
jgi:membrane-bound lytic murein transglycosylase B